MVAAAAGHDETLSPEVRLTYDVILVSPTIWA